MKTNCFIMGIANAKSRRITNTLKFESLERKMPSTTPYVMRGNSTDTGVGSRRNSILEQRISQLNLNAIEPCAQKKRKSIIGMNSFGRSRTVSVASLIGSMPKSEEVIIECVLQKMNSHCEWKSIRAALTATTFSMSNPGEDSLQDFIPLHQVTRVKRRNNLPASIIESITPLKNSNSANALAFASGGCELEGTMYILQICTIEDGYNCGRTFYLRTASDSECCAWEQSILTAVHAASRKESSAMGFTLRTQRRLGQFYRNRWTQGAIGVVIILGFVINITQTELQVGAPSITET